MGTRRVCLYQALVPCKVQVEERSLLLVPSLAAKLLTEKNAQHESCDKFYWGQDEDYSIGDSLSDSSEELLQSGKVGRPVYM